MDMKTNFSLSKREFEMYQLGCIHSKDVHEFDKKFTEKFSFNQPERTSEKDRCEICECTLLEYEKLTRICDNCDFHRSVCDVPNTPTKGSESSRND